MLLRVSAENMALCRKLCSIEWFKMIALKDPLGSLSPRPSPPLPPPHPPTTPLTPYHPLTPLPPPLTSLPPPSPPYHPPPHFYHQLVKLARDNRLTQFRTTFYWIKFLLNANKKRGLPTDIAQAKEFISCGRLREFFKKFSYYAGITLDALTMVLYPKLCRNNSSDPRA